MVVLFIVVANQALQCVGMRWCDYFSNVALVRMWELGLIEVMFEGILGNVSVTIYRRIKDKHAELRTDRLDKLVK